MVGVGGAFINYKAMGSLISNVGVHLGDVQSLINLSEPSLAPLVMGMVGYLTGGASLALFGFSSAANISGTHKMSGVLTAMHLAAGIEAALRNGSLRMEWVDESAVTGVPWFGPGAESKVVVFRNGEGDISATIKRKGSQWEVATPDRSSVITFTPASTPGQAPECIVEQIGRDPYSCTIDRDGAMRMQTQLTDKVSVIKSDSNGDGLFDRNWVQSSGQVYDLSNTAEAMFADSILSRVSFGGFMDDASFSQLSNVISQTLSAGTNVAIDHAFLAPQDWFNPIGAFYESKKLALDQAPSIARQTPVVLDAYGGALRAGNLQAMDVNGDQQISGIELNGLQVWIDANEDGVGDNGEFKSMVQAGITSLRRSQYSLITRYNGALVFGPPLLPARPDVAAGAPGRTFQPAYVPESNFRTLRDTDNIYASPSRAIVWDPSQVKINQHTPDTMVGTDQADRFDVSYYASYGNFFNLNAVVNFVAGGGDDVMGGSARSDRLWGGTGNDALLGYAGDDQLFGEEGNDELHGGAGWDRLEGGAGADVLIGHVGNDTLVGGEGNDALRGFTASNDVQQTLGAGEADSDVLHGGNGDDQMWGGPGADYIDGAGDNDLAYGDAGDDILFGGYGNDELHGDEGGDNLIGDQDDDRLFGEVGNDRLVGGSGNDLLVGFTASNDPKQTLAPGETDDDVLAGGTGNDWLYGGVGGDILDGGGDNDYLNGGAGMDLLVGGTGDDELDGGDGPDRLLGEAGNDKMFGSAGNDQLWGGEGDDILVGFTASNDAKQTLAAGETDDDQLYGGAGNDLLMGDLGSDVLVGETGDDELQGGAGNDQLYGGDGADRVFGQAGDDVLAGGAGDDLLVGFTGNNEAQQTLNAGETDNDTLYGGAGNDTLVGGLGNDYLDGGAGADFMEGGAGDDTYIVNSVNDVILEQANAGYDVVYGSVNTMLSSQIEELRLLPGGDTNGTGNAQDNRMVGNSGDNILDGVTGSDLMEGGQGNDTYYVDKAGDQVIEAAGEGIDVVHSKMSHTLANNVENLDLLDFGKPERGLIDGVPVLVYGYPKANELDYMQGDAVPTFQGTCALTSIANLLTQSRKPTNEAEVVNLAIDNDWAFNSPTASNDQRGGSNFAQQQAILDHYGLNNHLLAGYNEGALANLIRSGRGVIVALNAGKLWDDAAYVDGGGVNHVVTLTGVAYGEADGRLMGFFIADSGRQRVSDMSRYLSLDEFRATANVPNSYAIATNEALKLWNEDINATGNAQDNTLVGNRGNNVLNGKGGNDILIGGLGDDTYQLEPGSGDDVIIENDSTPDNQDVVELWAGSKASDLRFSFVHYSLLVESPSLGQRVQIDQWRWGPDYQVEIFRTSDGQKITAAEAERLAYANTPADTLWAVPNIHIHVPRADPGPALDTVAAPDTAFAFAGDHTTFATAESLPNWYVAGSLWSERLRAGNMPLIGNAEPSR